MRSPSRLVTIVRGKWGRSLAALAAFVWLAAACAPLAQIAPPTGSAAPALRQLTIFYTGYGRGQVEPPQPGPTCG